MTSKLIFACACAFMGCCIPAVQASDSMLTSQAEKLDSTINLLEQVAIFVLTGAVILMSIAWIAYIWKECASMKKLQKKSNLFLILVAALNVFCSSCSVEQRAMSLHYRGVATAEGAVCPSQHHHRNTSLSDQCPPSYGYFNGHNPSFCKYCGQRVFNPNW